MQISIIIPVYNTEAYLRQCLDSVLVDNAFTGQVICVNDGSTDGSLTILEEYRKKYPNVEVYSQENQGQSVARNVGLDKATGDYVLFLDSDDYYLSHAIETVNKFIEDNPDVDFFYMDCACDENGKSVYLFPITDPVKMPLKSFYEFEYEHYSITPMGCVCGGFYKREFIERNHLRMLPHVRFEDELFMMQLFLCEGICYALHIDRPFYIYRIGREGATTAKYTLQHFIERRIIAKACYNAICEADMMTESRRHQVFALFEENLIHAYGSGYIRDITKIFNSDDLRIMEACVTSERDKKLCKLASISPRLMAAYRTEALPSFIRRLINRWL
jgi:glycosyltransferase involved in cell wall biosynthesis